MILTLYTQRKIKIDMPRFIKYILCSYRLRKSSQSRHSFYEEISFVVLKLTNCDIRDYDNASYAMQALIKNACIYAIENDYSQADINMLKEIIDLL